MAGLPALGSPAMRFLISVMDTSTGSATSEEMAAIDVFNDRLVADGHWVLACGLAARPLPSSSTVAPRSRSSPRAR